MPRRTLSPRGPDRDAALAQYRQRAGVYDWELAFFEPIRRLAIARLALRPGDVVFDVGCGTGLSLSRLRQGVGPKGRVVGIEQSPEMIGQARRRVVASGLKRAAPWLMRPVDLLVLPAALRSVTSLDGIDQPWRLLQDQVGPMNVESTLLGGAYIASGVCAAS